MLSIVSAGERIENARFVEAPEQALLGFVGEAEAELDRRAEREAIPLAEGLCRHPVAADEGSVARAEVLEKVRFRSPANDPRVPAADARIVDADRAVPGATDDALVEEQRVHGAGVRAADEGQGGAARRRGNVEASPLDRRRRGDRGDLFVVLIELARPPTRRTRLSHDAPSPYVSPAAPHGWSQWETPDVPRNLSFAGITRSWSPKGPAGRGKHKPITTNSRRVMKSYEAPMTPEATTS